MSLAQPLLLSWGLFPGLFPGLGASPMQNDTVLVWEQPLASLRAEFLRDRWSNPGEPLSAQRKRLFLSLLTIKHYILQLDLTSPNSMVSVPCSGFPLREHAGIRSVLKWQQVQKILRVPEGLFNSLSIHEAHEELTAFGTRTAETAYILYLMWISCQKMFTWCFLCGRACWPKPSRSPSWDRKYMMTRILATGVSISPQSKPMKASVSQALGDAGRSPKMQSASACIDA